MGLSLFMMKGEMGGELPEHFLPLNCDQGVLGIPVIGRWNLTPAVTGCR